MRAPHFSRSKLHTQALLAPSLPILFVRQKDWRWELRRLATPDAQQTNSSKKKRGINSVMSDEATEIQAIIEARIQAVQAKDVQQLMAHMSPSALSYDVVNPLEYEGDSAVRGRAQEWFDSFAGPITLEVRDLRIAANANVAHCSSLNRIRGTLAQGGKVDMWVRSTLCFVKEAGRWLITHQHTSVPFDAGTGKAALDLTP